MLIQLIESPLGELTAYWSDLGLSRIAFGPPESFPSEVDGEFYASGSHSRQRETGQRTLARAVANFFGRREVVFPLTLCDWTAIPEFHRLVLERCVRIEPGQTLTYGQLAAAVGKPNAARAVGQAMARNRWPLMIPCHRVVGQAGQLTGYSGAGGIATKRALLDFESGTATLSGMAAAAVSDTALAAGG
jgi:methylated-DNA-[protein]-cysteine S-methyltransferase